MAELSGSVTDPALLSSSALCSARLRADEELVQGCQRLSTSSGSNGLRLRNHLASGWTSGFYRHHQALHQRSYPFFTEVHDELTKSWCAPYSSHIRPSASVAHTSVDGAEEKGYTHLPPLDESMAAHICPPMVTHISALNTMAVLQVFQAKMLVSEEAGLDSASLRDLRSTTNLALRTTKAIA